MVLKNEAGADFFLVQAVDSPTVHLNYRLLSNVHSCLTFRVSNRKEYAIHLLLSGLLVMNLRCTFECLKIASLLF